MNKLTAICALIFKISKYLFDYFHVFDLSIQIGKSNESWLFGCILNFRCIHMDAFPSEKLTFRVDEAIKATGLGRSLLYEAMKSGLLESFKVGGCRLIARNALLDFLDRHSRGGH